MRQSSSHDVVIVSLCGWRKLPSVLQVLVLKHLPPRCWSPNISHMIIFAPLATSLRTHTGSSFIIKIFVRTGRSPLKYQRSWNYTGSNIVGVYLASTNGLDRNEVVISFNINYLKFLNSFKNSSLNSKKEPSLIRSRAVRKRFCRKYRLCKVASRMPRIE